MPVIDDRVLVIASPDVGRGQFASVPARRAGQSPSPGDVAARPAGHDLRAGAAPASPRRPMGALPLLASRPCMSHGGRTYWQAVHMTDDDQPAERGGSAGPEPATHDPGQAGQTRRAALWSAAEARGVPLRAILTVIVA